MRKMLSLVNILLLGAPPVTADDTQVPTFGQEHVVEFKDIREYSFVVRPYKGEIEFRPDVYDPGDVTTGSKPDLIAMKLLSLMAKGEVREYYQFFSDAFRQAEYRRFGLSGNDNVTALSAQWRGKLARSSVRLTHRMDFGIEVTHHAVIRYAVTKDGETKAGQFVMRRRSDLAEWRVVDMSDNVLLKNWFFQGSKRVIRKEEIYGVQEKCEWAPDLSCKGAD